MTARKCLPLPLSSLRGSCFLPRWSCRVVTRLSSDDAKTASSRARTSAEEYVEDLVKNRHEKPNAVYYTALISGNINCERGSAAGVGSLLDEMYDGKVAMESSVGHEALKVSPLIQLWVRFFGWSLVLRRAIKGSCCPPGPDPS